MRQFSLSAAAAVDWVEKTAAHTRKNNAVSLMHLNDINSKPLPYNGMLLNNDSVQTNNFNTILWYICKYIFC